MVCMGNICRSPTAEAVLRHKALGTDLVVASAGTAAWHAGGDADPRSLSTMRAAGYDLSHRARQFLEHWFDDHDLVIAMDEQNRRDLLALRPQAPVRKLRDWDPADPGADVPDPYYGRGNGFAEVLAMVERSCDNLLAELLSTGLVHRL
jgi:protein-tyrosine phosphatase